MHLAAEGQTAGSAPDSGRTARAVGSAPGSGRTARTAGGAPDSRRTARAAGSAPNSGRTARACHQLLRVLVHVLSSSSSSSPSYHDDVGGELYVWSIREGSESSRENSIPNKSKESCLLPFSSLKRP